MKLTSGLIFSLGRSLPGSILNGLEGELEIPTTVLPTAIIPGPIQNLAGFDSAANQQDSFVRAVLAGLAASTAALTTTLATFGRGLWDLSLFLTALANFTQASDGTVSAAHRIVLVDPVAGAALLLSAWAVSAVPQFIEKKYLLLLSADAYVLQLRQTATGVGQTEVAEVSIVANRLL